MPPGWIQAVLEDAGNTPSNYNSQPWTLHIASWDSRDKLSAAFLEAASQQNFTWDFPFDFDSSYGIYTERRQKQGAAYYEAAGIRSEEHTSEPQSLMRTSYAVFCLKKNTQKLTRS